MNLFTSETLKIINANTVTEKTYNAIMKAAGSFSAYIRSLGGVFSKLYGKAIKVQYDTEFDDVAQYVCGLMYIFKFCYWNNKTWWYWLNKASKAFYSRKITNKGCREGSIIQLCTGADGRLRITNCNYGIDTFLKALGWYKHSCADKAWLKESGAHKVTSKAKFQKGDIVHFYKPVTGKWHHVAMVYKVESGKIWCIDFGSRYIKSGKPLHYMTVSGKTAGGEYGLDKWQCWHIMNLKKAPSKSTSDLAVKVIHGDYGNDAARRKALGTRFDEVQKMVNHFLSPEGFDDYIRACALFVLEDQAGRGDARKAYFGDLYDAVQQKVNWAMQTAQDVIDDKYGSGEARKKALGADYDLVQAAVNMILESE